MPAHKKRSAPKTPRSPAPRPSVAGEARGKVAFDKALRLQQIKALARARRPATVPSTPERPRPKRPTRRPAIEVRPDPEPPGAPANAPALAEQVANEVVVSAAQVVIADPVAPEVVIADPAVAALPEIAEPVIPAAIMVMPRPAAPSFREPRSSRRSLRATGFAWLVSKLRVWTGLPS